MEHLEQKETIYFLEWIAKESGFTENQILENMMPENNKWFDSHKYNSIEEFLKDKIDSSGWVNNIFYWEESFLKPDYYFWDKIFDKWYNLVKANEYNFEFSRYSIENWKIVKPTEKIKIKSKKLRL